MVQLLSAEIRCVFVANLLSLIRLRSIAAAGGDGVKLFTPPNTHQAGALDRKFVTIFTPHFEN